MSSSLSSSVNLVAIQLIKFCARVSAPVWARDAFLKRTHAWTATRARIFWPIESGWARQYWTQLFFIVLSGPNSGWNSGSNWGRNSGSKFCQLNCHPGCQVSIVYQDFKKIHANMRLTCTRGQFLSPKKLPIWTKYSDSQNWANWPPWQAVRNRQQNRKSADVNKNFRIDV